MSRIILTSVASAGILSLALIAPNSLQLLRFWKQFDRKKSRNYQSSAYIQRVLRRLQSRGLVVVIRENGHGMVRLTQKGKNELLKYRLQEKSLKKEIWDNKWRVLIFDIEEKKRLVRDSIRSDLQSFGFVRLQDSVWVYPYDCEEIIALLKMEYGLKKELLSIVAGAIENDAWLRERFQL